MASRLKELSSSTEDDEMRTVIVNGLCNYASATEVGGDVATEGDSLSLSNDSMSEVSLPEVCVSTNGSTSEEDTNYEVQQAYRIFTGFLLDKYKGITNPFLHPVGHQEAQHGVRGVKARGQSQLRQSICLQKIEKKFISHEYETITEFVTDFRLMLENCYRYHGVDHWVSKQAQKLERMLEQKLTLLSRTLREKTTLAVTSKGHFGAEEDRGSGGTSLRRRLAPRSIATLTVGGHESIMVQALRLEEQQRAKEEKKQRELEKKEAEEMSAKEVDEWEQSLLSQAHPQTVDTLWELPAIGHFLCLAQRALNLPEVVFFELERCLLMPRCSMLLSKIMSSLLSPPHRRASLHRQPPLPYHRWESELRQVVRGWYRIVGSAHDQPGRAQKLGLCHQFFTILGEVSPMEEKPFHMLLFHQRVWLLKGLCDHVYETHKDVQDAVLAQPIHECRESILGYDHKDNSYIHFPHFCGADLRIYCQSPSPPPVFPFPLVWVKRFEGTEKKETNAIKEEGDKNDREYQNIPKGLVCANLEDLRQLISKTEDELDDLESTKKRLGRWYYKKEAVKELHNTLIRLLNELSPWEPKLVKAYQRNRLRLKKEFDDFKNHPEYNNFVREEYMSSSSSDDDDEEEDEEKAKQFCSAPYDFKQYEEDDQEFSVPRDCGRTTGNPSRDETISSVHNSEDSRFGAETIPQNKSRDSEEAAGMAALILPKSFLSRSTIGLHKRYTPIPTLLAKSVGNKVTLMKQPVDCPDISSANVFSKGPAKPTQTESKSPIQVIYRTPEGLGQLVVKDSPMKFSVHPVVDKNTVKKTQQVVILPSKLLTQKTEEKNPYLPPLQSKSMESNGNVTSLIISTDAPGFSIPEDKSSVSQVVPLKDEQNCPSPILPYLQQGSLNSTAFRGSQACNVQPTKSQVVMPTPSQNSVSVLSDPVKTEDHKQELRTVCIRDSQSILVTTRCGNTGIVKVQTSSDQNRPGSFPTTPVITISPQLKAYLVSKTATLSKSSPSQTHSSTIPTLISNPVAHSHQQPPAEMTLPFTAPSPSCTTITSNTTTTGHVTTSNANTLDSLHLAAKVSTTTSSQFQGIPSLPVIAPNSWRSALSAGNVIKQDCGSPAHVMNTVESDPANTSPFSIDCQLASTVNGIVMETISSSSSKIVQSKTPVTPSTAPASWNPVSTSSTATVQQRIVINNSAPLAAGTQILLNNTCFVVPPQGLGPGNHVLIISQQVPNVGATCTGASVPFQAASHATISNQTPTFPHRQARLPGVPTTGAPIVPCTPVGGQSLLTKNPPCIPVRPAVPVVLGSILTKKADFEQSGNISGPPMEGSTLVACPSEIGRVPVLLSPMKTTAPAFSSPLATIRLAAPMQHECSSTILPAVASTFPQMLKPQSSVPAALPTNMSALHCSSPTQRIDEVPVSVSSFQKLAPVLPPVNPGTQTQALATVAVSPTIGSVSRMQTFPIATFPLIGNHFHTKTALGGSTTVTSAPLDHQPTALTSQGLEKNLLQTSTHSKWDPSFSSV
uniref:Bromo domain-containing protein n=1 Tax=Gouania willdenowi TaxID=441366 RepID=A0A8C5DQD2_GOUWI